MKQTLIATVGTSLLANANRAGGLGTLSVDDPRRAYRWLHDRDPLSRECGAEINSITELRRRGLVVDKPDLHMCVSATAEGSRVGAILKYYFDEDGLRTTVHVIDELQNERPAAFRAFGLRNLARVVGELVGQAGADYAVIDATGGYKAQIAIAVLIGQALGVDVYYKHERFSEIVSFPPMPISFDWSVLAEHADLLMALERGDLPTLDETEIDERLRVLLEEVDVDGERIWALAPIGQIYLSSYRYRFPAAKHLPRPASSEERRRPSLAQHHYPAGFIAFVDKVWSENEFVKTCVSFPYGGQPSIRQGRFRVPPDAGNDFEKLEGQFRNDFGARFLLFITATCETERIAAIEALTRRYLQ